MAGGDSDIHTPGSHVTCGHRPYLTCGQEHLAAWPLSSECGTGLKTCLRHSLNPNEPASPNRTKERREKVQRYFM